MSQTSLPDTTAAGAATGEAAKPSLDPMRPGLSGVTLAELEAWMAEHGEPRYRAKQVADAVWKTNAHDLSEVTNLPKRLLAGLDADFRLDTIVESEVRIGDNGETEKSLHLLGDGAVIESVLMHYPATSKRRERATLCISSQVGCAVGCPFCATGELGFGRNLTTAEIVDQCRDASRRLAARGLRLTNVVFMGMGEPFLNVDRVFEALDALSDPERFGLGARHITVSTSGVVPGIKRLTELGTQQTLAISLHAGRDQLRDLLVPLNRRWKVREVVDAAKEWSETTGRRVSYEYILIAGVNDTARDAGDLIRLLSNHVCHVNLIPMNQVAHTPWQPSAPDVVEQFAYKLESAGIPVTIRYSRGQEVGAACGQLAAERAGEPPADAIARRRELIVRSSLEALQAESEERESVAGGAEA